MKRKISEMLDDYRDDSVQLQLSAPLSSQRIKELTMNKVKKTHNVRRFGVRLLVAAAIVSALTMTAFAAERIFNAGDIIRDLFREELTDSQAQVMNELGGTFQPESQTSQGTTVTLAAAYGDAYMLHLYFQVEAPEGTVLPDGIFYEFCDRNATIDYSDPEHWADLKPGEDAPYKTIGRTIDIEPLPDENPQDNEKNFHVTVHGQSGTECKFNDGYSKFFNMTGIYEQVPNVDGDEDGYVLLAPGEFSFNVGMANQLQILELDVEGLHYGGHKVRTWTHDSPCGGFCDGELTGETDPATGLPIHQEEYDYQITVKSLTISPLGAQWTVAYESDDANRSFGLGFRVILKDGTAVEYMRAGLGDYFSDTESTGISYFKDPVELSEIDYVLIGDEELGQTFKVYLPNTEET